VIKKHFIILLLFCFSCQDEKSISAEDLITRSIQAHGFDKKNIAIEFDFREYHYKLIRSPSFYTYSRETQKDGKHVKDEMNSEKKLRHFVNNSLFSISDSIANLYSNSLNSVLYFFQLPKPLQDSAVIADILDSIQIKDKSYWTLKITFIQKGGGDDFQDEYRYWINKKTFLIDYLAYNYITDGGGTRFRKAINKRKQKKYVFQDYENYKPEIKFELLDELPKLYEKGNLKYISIIENKNILFLN